MDKDKQFFLQNELEDTQPYYNELKRLKELGEMPKRMEELTPKEMRRLWWEEGCFDPELAELFDVGVNTFKNFRYKQCIKAQFMLGIDKMYLEQGELVAEVWDTALELYVNNFK